MVKTTIKRRLVNPQKKRRPVAKSSGTRRAKRTARKSNPGHLITLGLLNPQRRTHVAKKAKKQKKARRPNPFLSPKKKAKKAFRRRHGNPSGRGVMSDSVSMLKFGLLALLGLLVTRQVPQLVLGTRNAGWAGYGSNFGTALVAYLGTRKFASRETAFAIGVGGMLYTVNRVLSEKLSPIGQALSLAGVGDANASGSLGRLTDIYSPMPVLRDRTGAPIIPQEIDARAAVAAISAAAQPASRVSGLSRANVRGRC